MSEIELRDLQLLELEILKEFDEFCKNNGLTYILAAGTLLGAVRHKGFIPWDDDVDVLMPREDYEKFRSTFKHQRYIVKSIKNDKDWPYSYTKCLDTKTELDEHLHGAKPIGVFIDIFPLDGLPDNKLASNFHFLKLDILKRILAYGLISKRSKGENVLIRYMKITVSRFCRFFNRKKLIRKIDQLASKYPYEHSRFVAHQVLGYGFRERIAKQKMHQHMEFEFESGFYFGPVGYHDYLRNLFGDYMELPPVEARVSHIILLNINSNYNSINVYYRGYCRCAELMGYLAKKISIKLIKELIT